ncbi:MULTISPECIES: DUF7311 family protein [Halorussus]|uniref:DUF7311 family protein n=1 Tax=Halorussus TaxID=1070314 RepID=UPI0020A0D9E0|nr:hypothetical protein [Halorussus vallis]USZ75406.1 hypothetical protein NGM07_18480 [Halorussus vallis]
MLRAVLAVVLAAAMLAVTAPALDAARTARADRVAADELWAVGSAAEELAREEDPVPVGSASARRAVALSVPDSAPTRAEVAAIAVGGVPTTRRPENRTRAADTERSDVLAYRLAGGEWCVRRVGVDLRLVRDGRVLRDRRALVRRGGTHGLTLRLVRYRGRPTVVVSTARDERGPGPEV